MYEKTPFPRLASHALQAPIESKKTRAAPAYIAVPPPAAADTRPSQDANIGLIPRPLQPKRNRMSTSTTTSNAETLVADSMFSPTSQRLSFDSAIKRTPTPHDGEARQEHLETLEEQSPDVGADDESESQWSDVDEDEDAGHRMRNSSASVYSDPYQNDELHFAEPVGTRRRSNSSGLGFSIPEDNSAATLEPISKPSQESMAQSNRSGSDTDRGTSHRIRYVNSSESIRPQYMSVRPGTAQSQSASSLWSSNQSDIVAPLDMPRKRAHMHSASLNSYSALPRVPASHLSTIASESERETQFSSRFSQATGLASVPSPSLGNQTWPRKRRTTVSSSDYSAQDSSPIVPNSNSDYSVSSGSRPDLMRNNSAIPDPLFSSSQPIPQRPFQRGSSTDPAEHEDTIAELQAPPLRSQRSGYLNRNRSLSDLRPASKRSNYSNAETDRWSQGSSIFPQWAKSFYRRGGTGFLSANGSRVTLANPGYASTNVSRANISRPTTRGKLQRDESNAESYATRPESSNSNWETIAAESPASRFLPGVFRPRTLARAQTDVTVNTPSRGSLSIYEEAVEAPPSPSPQQHRLKHKSARQLRSHAPAHDLRAVARNQSCHSQLFTTPMSTDPSYISLPHLVPNKRLSQHLSAWRVPSIDEPFPADYLGKGNRQILAFCFGFLFPPIWIVAAFLSLPQRPVDPLREEFNAEVGDVTEIDEADKKSVVVLRDQWGWEDERRFLKARWWRTLNRIMSVVGVGLLAAIIALAVLAAT